MMAAVDRQIERVLERESTVYAACGVSLALGLFFIFVWAPHPWGTEGFDHYHQLALAVAAGRQFPTMEVPWGYAYFLAAFYRSAGDHPAVPLVAQACLNALVPLIVLRLGSRWLDRKTAVLAALITGVCSFNTVYASTQSSDAVCTIIFMTAILTFARALDGGALRWYAVTGLLMGVAMQFRPNLALVPIVLAAYALAVERSRAAVPALMLVVCAGAVLMPWIVRNYRLTRMLVPASVHSGVQLWYGTLQVGPYLNSRAHNPRSVFESGVFDYTSLDHLPLVVTATSADCEPGGPLHTSLVYWTNRDPTRRTVDGTRDGRTLQFEAPASRAPAVFYYYVTTTWAHGTPSVKSIPPAGPDAPSIYFISHDHLGDLDLEGDLLDVFDLVRMMRHVAWNEPLPWADKLRAAGFANSDLESVVQALTRRFGARHGAALGNGLVPADNAATLTLADRSTITVPRAWRGLVTEVDFSGGLSAALMASTVRLTALSATAPSAASPDACVAGDDLQVNRVFYRSEPHLMRRYTALALDNISREPLQFALAAAYRAVRLFVVWGSDDPFTAQQFQRSRIVTAVATTLSMFFVSLFVFGSIVAWKRGSEVVLPLLLVLYIPATIAPMLTNMRYTLTVQPLMFMFVAAALMTLRERVGSRTARQAVRDPSDTRTARQP